jgi:hypothetical protein
MGAEDNMKHSTTMGWENSVRRSFVLDCYFLTNSLTPWSRVLLEKRTGFQLVKFLAFYET